MTGRRTHYVDATAQRIKAAINQHGQLHKRGLCRALDCTYTALDGTMAELQRRNELVILGNARDAGFDGRWDAPVYGLPGMTLTRAEAPVKETGSGQKALPNRGFEFRPLARDFYAHWKLAMETRR